MKSDKRYTIELEYCGYDKPRYALRFCGKWVSSHTTRKGAEQAQTEHIETRMETTK